MRITDMQLPGARAIEPAPSSRQPAPSGGTGADFGRIVASLVSSATEAVAASEVKAAQGIAGQVPVYEAVHAILDAEQKLAAAISVRDRCVAAYQEIVRMQI